MESLNDENSILYKKGLERTDSINLDSYTKKKYERFN